MAPTNDRRPELGTGGRATRDEFLRDGEARQRVLRRTRTWLLVVRDAVVADASGAATDRPRERMCGPPERGSLGLVDPRAQNAGEKVTTMLRLLNSPAESATHALAAHELSIVHNGATAQAKARTMPTARKAVRGLAEAPAGEAKWDFFENYAHLQVAPMGELALTLLRPAPGGKPMQLAAALATRSAGSRLVQPRTSGTTPTTGDTDGQLSILSEAEEDILRTGGANRLWTSQH
ncbi:hypothetical protein T492DRAFT_842671 [Pavlovales sp. CCMP2436]|nr:hypothetical protein T492DRAFT_842671 [Pavlovales sp. CCMP2436]